MKSTPSNWHLLHNVKLTVKILSIFVAFLENMNFMNKQGPLDIQTAIFEGYLAVWVCSTRNIKKMDF